MALCSNWAVKKKKMYEQKKEAEDNRYFKYNLRKFIRRSQCGKTCSTLKIYQ